MCHNTKDSLSQTKNLLNVWRLYIHTIYPAKRLQHAHEPTLLASQAVVI